MLRGRLAETPTLLEPRGRGSRRTCAQPSGRKGTLGDGGRPLRGNKPRTASRSCRPLVRRAITARVNRQSGPHIGLTIGTARDRGVRTARWKAPRADGGVLLFAEQFSSRGSQTCSIVPAVSLSTLSSRTRSGGARFADFRRVTSWMRRVRSPAKGGECPSLGGNFESQGPRGNHLQSDCRRDGRLSSIAFASKAGLQERWRSGIGSSAIVVRGSSGVSTPGAPRGRRRKVSSVGAFSSCVGAAKAPLTRERASRRHRRPRPSTYLLPGAIPTGHGTDGAARTNRFWLPPRASSRVGRGLEGSCCLVLAEGRFDDRSDRVSLFDSTARS